MDKDSIAISAFKAQCLAILRRVKETGRPIVVTKFGEPVAEVVPPAPRSPEEPWLGRLEGTARIAGDVVAPAADPSEWDALES